MKYRWIVFCLSIVCLILPARAAQYYVSSIHPSRSDSNPGTSSSAPWATLDKVKSAWGSLSAGDTVHMERGSVWNLTFSSDYWSLSRSGNSSAGPITLRGDDYGSGAKPIVRRAGGAGSCGFMLVQSSYVTLRDFVLDGGAKATLGIAVGAGAGANVSNVKIQNLSVTNLGGSSSQYICGIWLTSFNGRTISDCLIEGNYVADYSAHGLNHYSPYPLINITWRNNTVKNGFTGGRYPSANAALQITSGGSGNVFEYNFLEDRTTTEGGILGFGKYAGDTGTNTIRHNVIANSDSFGMIYTIDQTNKKILLDVYGNVFYNNDRAGLGIHPYNSYAAGTTFNVYNNTFYNNYTDGGDTSHGEVEFHAQCNNTRINFYNNLLQHRPYGTTVGLAVGSGFSGTLTHGNNLYWHETGTGATVVNHGSAYTVANVRNYESTAQQANPLFVSASQTPTAISSTGGASPNGLNLTASSPACSSGANLGTKYACDINQVVRTVPWSIGAYQYTSGGGGTTTPPPVTATAKDYYVSSTHAARNDANPGTNANAPWASFDKIKSMWTSLPHGSTVHLAKGSTWNLTFASDYWYIGTGGSATGGAKTIRGDDYGTGAKPVVRRTGSGGSCGFILVQNSYVTLRDFVLDGGHSDYAQNTLGIAVGSESRAVSNVVVKNMTIRNLGGSSTMYICGIWLVSPSYTISDCLIEGNEVSDYSAHGLNHYSQGPLVNVIWRNNTVKNAYTGGRYPSANSALQITSGGRGNVFEYNFLEDRTTTEGCILGFGKYAGDTGTNTIRHNVIANSDSFGMIYTIDQTNKKILLDVYGNVFYNNDRAGLGIHPYNSYAAGTTFNVYNNTFYNNYTDGGDTSHGEVEFHAQCNNTRINFSNNLLHHRPYGTTVGLAVGSGFSGTLTHGNNLYWHDGGSNQTVVTHGSAYTPANVRNYEATAQRASPQFVNASQVPTQVTSTNGAHPDGFDLTVASPASSNGLSLASRYATDINLNARTAPWSIGAYQFKATSRPKPPRGLRVVSQ